MNQISKNIIDRLRGQTIASSGSKLGSTPNSNSLVDDGPGTPAPPVPPKASGILALLSADRIGDDIIASESRWEPGCTTKRFLRKG